MADSQRAHGYCSKSVRQPFMSCKPGRKRAPRQQVDLHFTTECYGLNMKCPPSDSRVWTFGPQPVVLFVEFVGHFGHKRQLASKHGTIWAEPEGSRPVLFQSRAVS